MDKAQEICGCFATCLTMRFYISPSFPFINVFKRRLSYKDFSNYCHFNKLSKLFLLVYFLGYDI